MKYECFPKTLILKDNQGKSVHTVADTNSISEVISHPDLKSLVHESTECFHERITCAHILTTAVILLDTQAYLG